MRSYVEIVADRFPLAVATVVLPAGVQYAENHRFARDLLLDGIAALLER